MICYHLSSDRCSWKVGDVIRIGEGNNPYWQGLTDPLQEVPLPSGKTMDYFSIIGIALKCYWYQLPPPPELEGYYHFQPFQTLQDTYNLWGDSIKLLREMAFEAVRKERFPELPSRQRGLWLIPDSKESIEFWRGIIGAKVGKLYKVEATGKFHRTAQHWVVGDNYSYQHLQESATAYWECRRGNSPVEDEILFEGEIKILEVSNV